MSSTRSSTGGGRRSAAVVEKNHPAVRAATRGRGSRTPLVPRGSPTLPSVRESPHRAAKDKANERISAMHPPPIPVAEVVQSPDEESPDERSDHSSPNGTPVAAACASTSRESVLTSDDNDSIPRSPHVAGAKTTGLDDEDDSVENVASPMFAPNNDDDPLTPTDNEVSRYTFFDRLRHYLEGNKISEATRAAVELCIFVEAGTAVRDMDRMKKEKKESVYFQKYMSILDEIEDDLFVGEGVRDNMRIKYKNAKKENSGQSLWRKYETELTEIRNFAKKLPGVGNLSALPSGSNQLRHMKMPLVEALWKEKNPVQSHICIVFLCSSMNVSHY